MVFHFSVLFPRAEEGVRKRTRPQRAGGSAKVAPARPRPLKTPMTRWGEGRPSGPVGGISCPPRGVSCYPGPWCKPLWTCSTTWKSENFFYLLIFVYLKNFLYIILCAFDNICIVLTVSRCTYIYDDQGLLYHRTCKPDFLCSWPSLNSYLK